MNLKVVHLVLVQFGILIGIVACLVFLHFENARPRTAAEMREAANKRAASVEPKSESEDEDYRGELESDKQLTEQSTYPLPNEYSPEAVEKSRAILAKLYYQQIAPRRNATAVAPNYSEVAQLPAASQSYEPPPQTVAYIQPTEVVVYPQPGQFISFARPRPFVNRCRPAPHPSVLASNSPRRRNSGGTRVSGLPELATPPSPSAALPRPPGSLGLDQRRTTGTSNCPLSPGFTPRGKP